MVCPLRHTVYNLNCSNFTRPFIIMLLFQWGFYVWLVVVRKVKRDCLLGEKNVWIVWCVNSFFFYIFTAGSDLGGRSWLKPCRHFHTVQYIKYWSSKYTKLHFSFPNWCIQIMVSFPMEAVLINKGHLG